MGLSWSTPCLETSCHSRQFHSGYSLYLVCHLIYTKFPPNYNILFRTICYGSLNPDNGYLISGSLHSYRWTGQSTSRILMLYQHDFRQVVSSACIHAHLLLSTMFVNDAFIFIVQRRDVYGAWEQYLGLEHTDTTSKRSYTANQVGNAILLWNEWKPFDVS